VKAENAFKTWWRAYRSVIMKVERKSIDHCREVVNRHFAGMVDVKAPHRPDIVRRFTLATALREFTPLSLHEIAAEIGRNHSVVVYGRKKIRTRYYNDPVYGPIIQAIMAELEGLIFSEIPATTDKKYKYDLA